jgi:peptidoglycan/xylan/chitin deacetylase (PgdA/CDA1 family)
MRALVERPTLLALALVGALTLALSIASAAGLPAAGAPRLLLVVGAWSSVGALLGYLFAPGFDLPWRVIRRVPGRCVALTFDDGPHPQTTPGILAALERAGARATFFVVGEAAARWPELVRQIVAAGHCIGNHTQRHRILIFRTARQLEEEIDACQRALADAGVVTRLFRPPHGFKPIGLHRILRQKRLRLVAWQGSIRDTDAPGAATIVERAVALARAGRILLLHDHPRCADQTARAIATIVDRYRSMGFEFVALNNH